MWKVFKGFPRVLRQQHNGPARSSPVGTISAEEEEGTRLQSTLKSKDPVLYEGPRLQICTYNDDVGKKDRKPPGDEEWHQSFRKYSDFRKKLCLLESIGLGAAFAIGLNLFHYHRVLATRDVADPDVYIERRGSLSCLLRVAFSMPHAGNMILPEQQKAEKEVKQDENKEVARKAFEEACNSFMTLVDTYTGVSRNVAGLEKSKKGLHASAVNEWLEASTLGYHKADFNLGVSYELGRGTERNLARAAEHYKKAALAGHTMAQYNLAMLMLGGQCVASEDPLHAVNLLESAASQGLAQAQTHLGVLYATGETKQFSKAVSMFEAAAHQKDANAEYHLGLCYEGGLGVELNRCKAAQLFSKAAKSGHAKALYNLGVFYENGLGGLPEDKQYAKELYKQSASKGVSNAEYNLHRLEAMEALDEWTLREKTSSSKQRRGNTVNSMHVSHSSPNLRLLSKPDRNMNNTATEGPVKQTSKKTNIKINIAGDGTRFANMFDLNFGNFGTGSFSSYTAIKKEQSMSSCSLEESQAHQNQFETNCVAF